MSNLVIKSGNLKWLKKQQSNTVDLVYIDPPFNTGKSQQRGELSYQDSFDNFLRFIEPRLREIHRILKQNGTLYVHLDYREVHYVKLLLDQIFQRENFINEIIWAYDYGGRPKNKWPAKHDNILMYAKNKNNYTFNYEKLDRIPYMALGLVGPEKAKRGKTPTDCWWNTIVPTNGKEKTGYPTQKPLPIIRRIITASSNPGDLVVDCFAGSGTTGMACLELNRKFILVDKNPQAITIMKKRFAGYSVKFKE